MKHVNQQVAELSSEERELFLLMLTQEGVDLSDLILPHDRDSNSLPLSFTQERLWKSGLPAMHTAFGNVALIFEINGTFQPKLMETSLNQVVARHGVLRTTFSGGELRDNISMPQQVVHDAWEVALPIVNLEMEPEDGRFERGMTLIRQNAGRAFEFDREILLRPLTIQLAPDKFLLSFTLHHLITDGWGIRIFLREICTRYNGLISKKPVSLPTLPIQYADYTIWQREQLSKNVLKNQVTYWQKQLENAPRELTLPFDRPQPAQPAFESHKCTFEWSSKLTQAVRDYSRREGATLYMILFTAWQIVLQQAAQQKEIVTGTIISTRNKDGLTELIGNFGNNLLIRTDFSGNPTFHTLLAQVKDKVMAGFEHQDLPLELLTDRQLPRFHTMFVMRDSELAQGFQLANLTLHNIPLETGMMALDIIFDVSEGQEILSGHIEYQTALFDVTTIEKMLADIRQVIEVGI